MLLPSESLVRVLGDRTAKSFARHLDLHTVADLLQHYPRRYSSRGELTPIADLPIGEMVSIVADIVDVRERHMTGKKGSILEVRITDGNGTLSLTFFNQAWRQKDLKPGTRGLFAGKIGAYQGRLQLTHPDYELFPDEITDEAAKAWADLPIPIYPASSTVTTWMIQRAMGVVLDTLAPVVDELPEGLTVSEGLLSLGEAISLIHRPKTASDWQMARDTLRFHEAFLLQAALVGRKLATEQTEAIARVSKPGGLVEVFDAQLPFTLTEGQRAVGQQIAQDLGRAHPMNRLLQGEVGSGKTLVALRAMLTVADSGGQTAMLAPTDVLATQHFASIAKTLGPDLSRELGLTLLTGSLSAADKKRALLQIVSGKALLVVGTHALIADRVEFLDLGLIVVDEQHRFGVEQREALRLKGKLPPHVLTMTATPIPRTLAVTVFGDLDVSTLTELPAGRKEIQTHVVQLDQPQLVARVWARVAEEVAKGRQAFVVCPRIEESDNGDEFVAAGGTLVEDDALELLLAEDETPKPKRPLAAATSVAQSLQANPTLKGVRIGLMHGKMSSDDKASAMEAFARGDLDVLVSTTVIEVGVDVPNATVMVILDAERFGVSQLHQLRGRVGRGGLPGLCLLLTGAEAGTVSLERVQAVASTIDGFKLSELDLELRREGDVLGSSQSGGRSSLRLLRVVHDAELIFRARKLVEALYAKDPQLTDSPSLALALAQQDEARQENLSKS
jgi:ATP-dependent DNA helicase RecG